MSGNYFYLNRKLIPANPDLLRALSPGVLDAHGVFETMRAFQGKPVDFERHADRLRRGLSVLKLRSPWSTRQWQTQIADLLEKNRLAEARVRLMVWKDKRSRSSAVNTAVTAQPLDISIFQAGREWKVMISKIPHPGRRVSYLKSLACQLFRAAWEEAQQNGYDEAILLNKKGEVVEGSRANVFFVKNGILYTPALACGALNGIVRQIILERARAGKIPVRVIRVRAKTFLSADKVFLTNSVIGVVRAKTADALRHPGIYV